MKTKERGIYIAGIGKYMATWKRPGKVLSYDEAREIAIDEFFSRKQA